MMTVFRPYLKNIGIGSILKDDNDYPDENIKAIYQKYRSYFKEDLIDKFITCYRLKKEPSPELISDLQAYENRVNEEYREYDEYLDSIARDAYENLSQEDKDYLLRYPDSTHNHFSFGMNIRNHYDLWGEQPEFLRGKHPDSISSEITERVSSFVISNYDFYNPFYRGLYGDFVFNYYRRLYYAYEECYPDDIMERYDDMPDYEKAISIVWDIVSRRLFDKERFYELCKKYRISDKHREEIVHYIDEYNDHNWDKVPYDIGLLGCRRLDPKLRERCIRVMKAVFEDHPYHHAHKLPTFMFNQKDAVLVLVEASGDVLKRVKKFNADDDVIKTALKSSGTAIQYVNKDLRYKTEYLNIAFSYPYSIRCPLQMRCMKDYRDKEEWVRRAVESDGTNIQYASKRLRADFELAKLAVLNDSGSSKPAMSYLSKELRDNMDLALIDIREGGAGIDAYSFRLRDSEIIAEELLKTKNSWKLYKMSSRIKKKYGVDH